MSSVADVAHDLRGLGRELLHVVSRHDREVARENGLDRDVDAVSIVWATGVTGSKCASRQTL